MERETSLTLDFAQKKTPAIAGTADIVADSSFDTATLFSYGLPKFRDFPGLR